MWPRLRGGNHGGRGVTEPHRRKPWGRGVAKFHKGVVMSHKRKPWWRIVAETYKETMGGGVQKQ